MSFSITMSNTEKKARMSSMNELRRELGTAYEPHADLASALRQMIVRYCWVGSKVNVLGRERKRDGRSDNSGESVHACAGPQL